MNKFNKNWDFQKGYYNDIKNIINNNAIEFIKIRIASEQEDKKRATDFVVEIEGGEIAVRIRRAYRYRDLTIRAVNNGWKTEIHKLQEGFAKFYLYCWTDEYGHISEYILVDCDQLRDSGLLNNGHDVIMNKGGKTGFIAIGINELNNNDCLIKHWESKPKQDYIPF